MVNSTNTQLIESYFKDNACESVYNYKTRYKAVCFDKVVVINDYFSIDFSTNEEILFKDIVTIQSDKNGMMIKSKTKSLTLSFEKEAHLKNFETTLNNTRKRVIKK